ncbi:helix-turn-helix transcriptional regulator [Nitrosovibrio tenuis]|uniref:DNA binding domain-containing protein, excisionase family n=1 Tax=Nitrosovibrio tenuis TaxID=1233 RepID=A0A1H7KPC4_9PROT|nr:helix-turn-helix domain-containing protein [Nitrosovibrio tenuis]SEK88681.1 DNA binding domain-containing protein, excisionase family [Nitrosovibrio tenuis]
MQGNLLSTREAAVYLSVSEAFLERDRWAGAKVPFIKIGSRAVRYRLQDLERYIESCIRKSTSDTGRK